MESGRENKIIAIVGPTASGKSDVAIKLAQEFSAIGGPASGWNGAEIISADSRQIYRGMDIGTGKVINDLTLNSKRKTKNEKPQFKTKKLKPYCSEGIPHYMIDIVSPNTEYNVAKFKRDAEKAIDDILSRGKVPIIAGGTGFWVKAIVDNVDFPEVKPDWNLRKKLNNKTAEELFDKLKKLDPERAKTIDPNNKVRLIRAIEICKTLGNVPKINQRSHPEFISGSQKEMLKQVQHDKKWQFLQLGISWPKEKLDERIKIRLDQRFDEGMIDEVANLHFEKKVSWKRLENFGLEYQRIAEYLQGKISEKEMRKKLYFDIVHYAKRQMTWFKKDKRITWFNPESNNFYDNIKKETKEFLIN